MSKFKVSFINLVRLCFIALPKDRRRYLYLFAFFKNLHDFLPFADTQSEERTFKYWVRHTVPETLAIADRLFEEERYLEVYELLNRIRFRREVEVLWRIARVLYNISFEKRVTQEERWEMIEEALEMLQVAIKIGL